MGKTSRVLAIHAWLKPTIFSRSVWAHYPDTEFCWIWEHHLGVRTKQGPTWLIHTYRTHKAKQSCSCKGLVWNRHAGCRHWNGLKKHVSIQTLRVLIRKAKLKCFLPLFHCSSTLSWKTTQWQQLLSCQVRTTVFWIMKNTPILNSVVPFFIFFSATWPS